MINKDALVVVTGASSGIGREMARQLAARVKAVVLVARRRERLDELASELRAAHPALRIEVRACDLTDDAAAVAMIDALEREVAPVDVLINNAGFGDFGLFADAEWGRLEEMLRLNVVTLTRLTHRVLRGMVERRRGSVLNVSSGVGLIFVPMFTAYTATKHYVTGFTEALRLELRGTGVVVSQVCPGPVASEFQDVAGAVGAMRVPRWAQMSAARCARISLAGLERGRALIVPGLLVKLGMGLAALTPRFVLRWLLGVGASMTRRQLAATRRQAA